MFGELGYGVSFDYQPGKSLLDNARYLFKHRDPLGCGDGKCAQFASGDQVDDRQGCNEHELVSTIQKIGNSLRKLWVWHVSCASPRLQFE